MIGIVAAGKGMRGLLGLSTHALALYLAGAIERPSTGRRAAVECLPTGKPSVVHTDITLRVDGTEKSVTVDTRTTVLDLLRERLGNTSPKKGCDHGQCGACTIFLDGRRILACMALAVAHDGAEVTTADGLAADGALHRVQWAFLDRDAFQCGYCTPGQICSAVGLLEEFARGRPSAVTADVAADPELDHDEVAERMSGNLCRCAAYAYIVPAVQDAARGA